MNDNSVTPEEITPEAAEAELAALEQSVIDGGNVTVADLTAAKERISFARLVRQGIESRAAAKKAKAADELRAKTKVDVAAMFAGGQYSDPLKAYDKAVRALDDLAKAIGGNNELLVTAYRALSAGGVAVRGWDGTAPEGHDTANTASVGQGELVQSITTAGATYGQESPALWVRAVVQDVAAKHGGLPVPYSSSLESAVRGDKPAAIKNRKA